MFKTFIYILGLVGGCGILSGLVASILSALLLGVLWGFVWTVSFNRFWGK